MECQKCKKALSKKGAHFLCQGTCQGTFHRACVKGLAADLKNGKNRLFCNNCEEDDRSEEEPEEEMQDFANILKDIQKKVRVIPGLKKDLESITQSLSLLSDKYDTLIAEHNLSKQKIQKLENTIVNISNKCVYLEKCNTAIEQKLNEFEQASRKHNIEIVGVEQLPNENIKEIVTKIATLINVSCDDIEWARRARPQKVGSKAAPILVGFRSSGTRSRDNWLVQRRKASESTSDMITGGSDTSRLYINEDLTKSARALLWTTKNRLRGIYKYIWVNNGRILIKKADGEKTICVRSECEIDGYVNN